MLHSLSFLTLLRLKLHRGDRKWLYFCTVFLVFSLTKVSTLTKVSAVVLIVVVVSLVHLVFSTHNILFRVSYG